MEVMGHTESVLAGASVLPAPGGTDPGPTSLTGAEFWALPFPGRPGSQTFLTSHSAVFTEDVTYRPKRFWFPDIPQIRERIFTGRCLHSLLVAETYEGPLQRLLDSDTGKRQLSFQPSSPVLTTVYLLVSEQPTLLFPGLSQNAA